MATQSGVTVWVRVCDAGEPVLGIGVSALVRGKQVALFTLAHDEWYAVGNRDPYSGTPTMARGVAVRRDGSALIAAPAGRQLFDLATGQAVDDPMTRLPTYPVRIIDGYVEVCVPVRA